jgi:integrase
MATIRKRKWTTKKGVTVKYVADFTDQKGDRHERLFDRRGDAAEWLKSATEQARKGGLVSRRGDITLAQAADNWLDECKANGLERVTITGYEKTVLLHILPTLGAYKLSGLDVQIVKDWRKALLETSGLSRYTAAKVRRVLQTIVTQAIQDGHIGHNVVKLVGIRVSTRDDRKLEIGRDIPTKKDVARLLEVCAEEFPGQRAFLLTAALTGMRASELRGLPWSAVDFDKKVIMVRQRADRFGVIGRPKSKAGYRDIPIAPYLVRVLREWKVACPNGKLHLVFPTRTGTVQPHSNLCSRFWRPLQRAARILDEAGKPKYGFHSLRHYAASVWIEAGFTAKRLQERLGHESYKMTFDTYGHLFPASDADQEIFARIERELGLLA